MTIASTGAVQVVNPAFDPAAVCRCNLSALLPRPRSDPLCTTDANDTRLKKTITRDYGFGGTQGTVTLGNTTLADQFLDRDGTDRRDGAGEIQAPAS